MTERRKRLVLTCMMCTSFLTMDMVRVAFPAMMKPLGISVAQATWLSNSYMLSCCLLMPVFGQIGDVFGRERSFKLGVVIHALGAAWCGSSASFQMLVCARLFQGCGFAMLVINGVILATHLFPEEQRGRVVGLWGASGVVAGMVSPAAGGFLVQYFGWRSVFYVSVPVGLAIITGLQLLLPRRVVQSIARRDLGPSCDVRGMAVLSLAMLSLMGAFWTINGSEVRLVRFVIPVLASTVLYRVLIVIEGRSPVPLLDLRVFSRRPVFAGLVCGIIELSVNQTAAFLLPLLLARVRGLSPLETGLLIVPGALARGFSTSLGGILVDKIGNKAPVQIGLAIMALSCGMCSLINGVSSKPYVILAGMLLPLGEGLVWSSNLTALLRSVPASQVGASQGIYNSVRVMFGIITMTVTGLTVNALAPQVLPEGLRVIPGYSHSYLFLMAASLVGVAMGGRLVAGVNARPDA